MSLRAYLLIDVIDNTYQQEFVKALRELEEIPGVDFVDPVIGRHDLVVMVDPPVSTEAIAREIKSKRWVKDLEVMKVASILDAHRGPKQLLGKTASAEI